MKRLRNLFSLLGLTFSLLPTAPVCAVSGDEHFSPEFGWPGTGDIVYSITTHNGRLYASGGASGGSGTNTTINVWDGAHWSTLGQITGASGTVVYDLAFVGETLYVAGFLRTSAAWKPAASRAGTATPGAASV